MNKGYTLIEMLVVIVVFATISIVASETIILTLRGTFKATSITAVRQNVDYAMNAMESQIRGAKRITSTCDGTSQPNISFLDQNNSPVTFSCVGINNNNQPASQLQAPLLQTQLQ